MKRKKKKKKYSVKTSKKMGRVNVSAYELPTRIKVHTSKQYYNDNAFIHFTRKKKKSFK